MFEVLTPNIKTNIVEQMKRGDRVSIPGVVNTEPPENALKKHLLEYVALAQANGVKTLSLEVGQLLFTYDIESGQISEFDGVESAKRAGLNLEVMKQKTQAVIDSLKQ